MSDLIGVALAPKALRVSPGEEVSAVIQVQNLGRVVDANSIEVRGLDAASYEIETDIVSLFPGDAREVHLVVNVPSRAAAVAGSYEFTLKASSSVFPEEETTIHHTVEIVPVTEYVARVRPELVTGRVGEYSLSIDNTGNTEITLDLGATDREEFCRSSFSANPVVVGPGSSMDLQLVARPKRRPLVEPARTYNLTVNVAPQQSGERTSLNARLEAVPYARKWYFPVALLVLLLMAWLGYTVYWFVLERDELTYLREEKWDDLSESEEIMHGRIRMFEFELACKREVTVPLPPPISIRGSVSWPDIGDTPPTIGIVVRGPNGNCWGPKMVDRVGEPFSFTVNDGGAPCHELEYGWLLMDVSDPKAPMPAVYGAGVPLTEYCVRDVKENPVVKFFKDGEFQTPYVLVRDHNNSPISSPEPVIRQDDKWSIYLVNPHPQWPVAPEVSVRLKAVDSSPHSWRKNDAFSVQKLELPPPKVTVPRLQCGWDTKTDIPKKEGGLEHGQLYVRLLEISPRIAEESGGELTGKASVTMAAQVAGGMRWKVNCDYFVPTSLGNP